MEYINISHERRFDGTIHSFSSELDQENSIRNLLTEGGYWSSEKRESVMHEYFIIDYQKAIIINYIEFTASPDGAQTFPRTFRIESSMNGTIWKVIHTERKLELEGQSYKLDIPLTQLCLLKVVITEPQRIGSKYISEIGGCIVGISGIKEITSNSISWPDNSPSNLFDNNPKSFWESAHRPASAKEYIDIDLGAIFHINRIVLGSSNMGFPEYFNIVTSSDKNIWTSLFEVKEFKSENFIKYYWDIDLTPVRYIRIELMSVKLFNGKYCVQLSELIISAAFFNPFHMHNIGDLISYSSIFQSGIVKLARDGEDSPGIAVQGSDKRLKDATTLFKGIIQLAKDGEVKNGLVVQASDSRIKQASENKPGIVRLAHNRESKPAIVVQGNDSRLQESTVENFGIVRLCPDGLYNEQAVVTGNDSRIKFASIESNGICRLAKDGDDTAGSVVQANDKRLRSATTSYKGIVELADDGEGGEDVVVQGSDKRLKDATTKSKGIVELADNGEDNPGVVVQGNDRRLKDATTRSKGIVELAKNGEDKLGVVVQGNDRRLKDATTGSMGIVELAEDGGVKSGTVVQANDRRLKDAAETTNGILRFASDGEVAPLVAVQASDKRLFDSTTISKGIVELAEDGEDGPGVAVQGNDRRLKDATTKSKGIVELAENGEDRPGVAVQGNDNRLGEATETSKGILRFASQGEVAPFAAVQANDKRLNDATTVSSGIIELAEDGEDGEGVVVQGNDRRLKNATEISMGIVELAENGEDCAGVVIQGNDKRLKMATEKDSGIVKLAKQYEVRPGFAVQANDERLANKRFPLPHNHEYAPFVHEFKSHTGTIAINNKKNETFKDITPPSDNSSIIHAKNDSKNNGSIGVAGVAGISSEKYIQSYGIVGHSNHVGVRGQSSGNENIKGCGVLGISRFGAGGVFSSEHSYSLIAEGFGNIADYDNSVSLIGNGDALYVNGRSEFNGQIFIHNCNNENQVPANIVELFEVDEEEYISSGDLLVVSDTGDSILSRARTKYSRSVVGIVSGNPALIINNSGKEKKLYPVTLAGKVLCRVDARNSQINPGDLIVTSDTPGCGMAGVIDSFDKIGTVIGKSLDKFEDGLGVIPIFIALQ